MFGKRNQFATVKGFNVRVKDDREADRNHIIETSFEIPLSHDLADEIMPAMARDLFQESGGEWTPKPEIREATFNLAPETQILAVRPHPDSDPMFIVPGVSIRKIHAKKIDSGSWVLHFTCGWPMKEDVEATSIIRVLRTGVYVTFEVQAPALPFPGDAPDNGQTATVDQGGVVANIADAKKGRKKRTAGPEAEGEAQVQEGRKKAAEKPH